MKKPMGATITFRLSKKELKLMQDKSAQIGLPVGTFCRAVALAEAKK